MRLIDADAMNEELFYEQAGGKDTLITCETAFDMIKAQPTVYDVDKVVDELEKLADASNDHMYESYFDGKEDGIREAIEIVKAGWKHDN